MTNSSPTVHPTAVVEHHERTSMHIEEAQPTLPTIRTQIATRRSADDVVYTQNTAADNRYYERRLRRSPSIPPHVPRHRNNSTESREYYRETRRL